MDLRVRDMNQVLLNGVLRCLLIEFPKPHHAVPSQEVGDDGSVNVVHQPSWTLVIVSSVNKELPAGVVIKQRTDLVTRSPEKMKDVKQ